MGRRRPPPAQEEIPSFLEGPESLAFAAAYEHELAQLRSERLAAAAGRPVALDCEVAGKTSCWSCALDGPERCDADHLPPEVHDACVAEAHRLAVQRRKAPCHDCAFLRGSAEARAEGLLEKLVRQREPFRCHQAMPLDGRGQMPRDGDYAPDDAARYPICGGWAAARATYFDRVRAAKALRQAVQAAGRCPPTTHERVVRALGRARLGAPRRRVRPQLGRVARHDLLFLCTTQRRRAVRLELAIAQQRLVTRGFAVAGELHRREVGGEVQHRVVAAGLATPWIAGEPESALDAFAVVLVRAGIRARAQTDQPDPPYTRPPPKKPPPRPRSKGRPRPSPKPLVLRAA